MRGHDEPVEVRRAGGAAPEQFLWRGRLWKVRDVLGRETASGREVWRVVAGGPGAGGGRPGWGVVDLALDDADGRWSIVVPAAATGEDPHGESRDRSGAALVRRPR